MSPAARLAEAMSTMACGDSVYPVPELVEEALRSAGLQLVPTIESAPCARWGGCCAHDHAEVL